jgi:hypothetical protein
MRNALLLITALVTCRESATASREPAWRRKLRADALGCFAATRVRVGPEYSPRPYFFRLDSMQGDLGWHPGSRKAWPASWEIVREVETRRDWVADSLTDTIRVLITDGFAYSRYIFDLRIARDTFAGYEAYGGDVGDESRGRIVVTRVRCADYTWVMKPDSEY